MILNIFNENELNNEIIDLNEEINIIRENYENMVMNIENINIIDLDIDQEIINITQTCENIKNIKIINKNDWILDNEEKSFFQNELNKIIKIEESNIISHISDIIDAFENTNNILLSNIETMILTDHSNNLFNIGRIMQSFPIFENNKIINDINDIIPKDWIRVNKENIIPLVNERILCFECDGFKKIESSEMLQKEIEVLKKTLFKNIKNI